MAEYELKDLIDKYGLPLKVKMPRFYGDFYFLAEKENTRKKMIEGSQFSNGSFYRKKSYGYSEPCCLLEYPTAQEDNATKGNQQSHSRYDTLSDREDTANAVGNPNNLETDKSKYIKGVTLLFVVKDSRLLPATFERFETKNGKDVIYVDCQGKVSFYPFPQSAYVFPNKDDGNTAIGKSNRMYGKGADSQYIIAAYNKHPLALIPSPNKAEELKAEQKYHKGVNDKLCQDLISPKAELTSADADSAQVERDYRQACIEARENGMPVDDHSIISQQMRYSSAQQRRDSAYDRISKIEAVRARPYFGRVDCGGSIKELHTAYIGDTDIPGYVVDWRHPEIGNVYYHSSTFHARDDIVIALKRVIDIVNASFVGFEDEINIYHSTDFKPTEADVSAETDSLLTRLLRLSREDKHTHDIIKTIQGEQYDIITSDFLRNAVINGCAGSGKTMIMYHRLSYIAYNYQHREGKQFDPDQVFVVSPSVYFDLSNNALLKKLSLEHISHGPFDKHVKELIRRQCRAKRILPFVGMCLTQGESGHSNKDIYSQSVLEEFLALIDSVETSAVKIKQFQQWVLDSARKLLEKNGFSLQETSLTGSAIHDLYWSQCLDEESRNRIAASERGRYYTQAKNAITTISIENILCALKEQNQTSKSYKARTKKIDSYYDILSICLSDQTKKLSNGSVATNISDFWRVFDRTSLFEKLSALIVAEKLIEATANQQQEQYYLLKCEYAFNQLFSSTKSDTAPLYYLAAVCKKYGAIISGDSFVFIDEFQNYSPFEIDCLKAAFQNPIFNLYGDFDQRIDEKGAKLAGALDSLLCPNMYNINVNYRNAKQITQYINKSVHKNMQPIGIDGTVSETQYVDCQFEAHDRTAVIVKDITAARKLLNCREDKELFVSAEKGLHNNEQIILIDVSMCKGLEFDTVYVFEAGMNDNEKYVAFTRALDKLVVIVDHDLEELYKKDLLSKMARERLKAIYGKPDHWGHEEKDSTPSCSLCGNKMMPMTGRRGRYWSCPECKTAKPLLIEQISAHCPKCGSAITNSITFNGTPYYKCTRSEECDFVSWRKPTSKKCSECGEILYEREKNGAIFHCCINTACSQSYKNSSPLTEEVDNADTAKPNSAQLTSAPARDLEEQMMPQNDTELHLETPLTSSNNIPKPSDQKMNKDLEAQKDEKYWNALQAITSDSIVELEAAELLLIGLDGWRDSQAKIPIFRRKINMLKDLSNREKQNNMWRTSKQCQHCGGTFKGLFIKTCKLCGKRKDY